MAHKQVEAAKNATVAEAAEKHMLLQLNKKGKPQTQCPLRRSVWRDMRHNGRRVRVQRGAVK